MKNTENGTKPNPEGHAFGRKWRIWLVGYVKRKYHERPAKEKNESAEQRALRLTMWSTAVIAIFTVVLACVSYFQLKELHQSGVDSSGQMNQMIEKYREQVAQISRQADETRDLAVQAKNQADRTKDMADRMKDQADRTKIIADQAIIQANAAKSAASIAGQTLHISERAYLTLGTPADDFQNKQISIPIINSGHIPSGKATIIAHEITFQISIPLATIYSLNQETTIERHWTTAGFPTVAIGNPFVVDVEIPSLVMDDLNNGKQGVAIAIEMIYNDGFPNTPDQRWVFCDISVYSAAMKRGIMRPCDDPEVLLRLVTALDRYPDTRYQQIKPY